MKYEVSAEEQNVEVACDGRIPDDILRELQLLAEKKKTIWNTDACRETFFVTCKSSEAQQALLESYGKMLLSYNWL